jgi:hypothetical protein
VHGTPPRAGTTECLAHGSTGGDADERQSRERRERARTAVARAAADECASRRTE